MTDDLIKVTRKVLDGELKFTDKMLLALYEALEEEIGDAISCDTVPLGGEATKLDSETRRLDKLMQDMCKKFDISRLRYAEEEEKKRISNIGYAINDKKLEGDDLITVNLGLRSNDITADWHIKHVNDKKDLPIECVWTTATLVSKDPHVTVSRFYKIIPIHKTNAYGVVLSEDPKYFCLFESLSLEDSNVKLVAVFESFCQAAFSIAYRMHQINLLKEYFKYNEERKDTTVCSAN